MTLPLLDSASLGRLQDSVWEEELQYDIARTIMSNRSVLHPPLDCRDVISAGTELLEIEPAADSRTFSIDGRHVEDWQIINLIARCEHQSPALLERPLPVPDARLETADSWIESIYSSHQLLRFAAELLGNACRAYEEATTSLFASFRWSLSRNAYQPVASLGFLVRRNDVLRGHEHMLGHVEVPAEVFQRFVDKHPEATVASNSRAAVLVRASQQELIEEVFPELTQAVSAWALRSGQESPFLSQGWTLEGLAINAARPASQMAAKWIYSELKNLSLASGTFRQFSR
ncbi:hypothetical protein [Crystallibacter crystallopoietes]|uniref:hypothetical protein n=1 Tax=Crystallibacter crystallopoietes TaxID=37928 RepID=UPI0012372F83|nr:hypothetical protein [Arthrobacter crystallopoietes]